MISSFIIDVAFLDFEKNNVTIEEVFIDIDKSDLDCHCGDLTIDVGLNRFQKHRLHDRCSLYRGYC